MTPFEIQTTQASAQAQNRCLKQSLSVPRRRPVPIPSGTWWVCLGGADVLSHCKDDLAEAQSLQRNEGEGSYDLLFTVLLVICSLVLEAGLWG